MNIVEHIQHKLQAVADQSSLVVAYSGGVDSHVLLHVLTEYCNMVSGINLQAVHINHQLQAPADDWQAHCARQCQALQVPFKAFKVEVEMPSRQSLEASARQARYKQLATALSPGDILLTAQHQDDQAETVLLQLFRGAGVKGLSAMPEMKPFAQGQLFRPLLEVSKACILEYALAHKLNWIEDPSNQDHRFDRNFLRHRIMPLLSERWPSINGNLTRVAQHCASADDLLRQQAEQDVPLQACSQQLAVAPLAELSPLRVQNALRHWIGANGFQMPSTQQLEQIVALLSVRADHCACVEWHRTQVRRFKDTLYIMPALLAHDPRVIIPWTLEQDLALPSDLGVLTTEQVNAQWHGELPLKDVTIRFRQGGEKIRLPGHAVTHTLKNLMQQWGIPPWLRDRVPLIYSKEQLLMVVGYNQSVVEDQGER